MVIEVERVVPYVPIWKRLPNKFVRMDRERYDDGCGHRGTLSVAKFVDKKGNEREMVARIEWD